VVKHKEECWKHFTQSIRTQLSPDDPTKRVFVQESWERSRKAGVNIHERLLRRVENAEIEKTIETDSLLLKAAKLHVEYLSQRQHVDHVVCLTNERAVILLSVGDPIWRAIQGLMPGFDWSESVMGTNGAGTALVTDQVVALIGPEHYRENFHNATCLGVPLHSPTGELIGALDFSTRVEDTEANQLVELMKVGSAIEADYALVLSKENAATSVE
jgi:transcriptional regulator of acetoin/glycerol metabolism